MKPESSVYEESSEKKTTIDDVLALLVSIEKGDDNSVADKAIEDVARQMAQLKRKRLVVYPFAHLSSNLSEPKGAMALVDYMAKSAEAKGFEVRKAPFGWNKKLSVAVKGHPLAEQARSYGAAEPQKHRKEEDVAKVDTSIVRKSEMSGLPETDHRTIGEKLDLFSFQEVSPGMVYWHRNGLVLYRQLTNFMREMIQKYNYEEISTPTLANVALWHVSGHISHYKDNMFVFNSEKEQLGMKPMNCPSTIMIFKSKKWSYRELPFRTAIFDRLYRNEISGALTGLFRVRELTQDDGHIFIAEEQLGDELKSLLKLVKEVYDTFQMQFKAKLSTMPDEHLGDEALWERATDLLKNALEVNGMKYEIKDKDGAFYGPKIDFDVFDSMGRSWQCATLQLDYQLPIRFKLEYAGEDGKLHTPIMIHRAILGSLERFTGILIEHYQGKFPTWLAPIQTTVISISEAANAYSDEVYSELKKNGIRTSIDVADKTLEYKIRDAQMQKVPYMLVVGKKEQDSRTVTIRDRAGKQEHGVKIEDFVKRIKEEIGTRKSTV
jgi:threonyl-tRNA synthetase